MPATNGRDAFHFGDVVRAIALHHRLVRMFPVDQKPRVVLYEPARAFGTLNIPVTLVRTAEAAIDTAMSGAFATHANLPDNEPANFASILGEAVAVHGAPVDLEAFQQLCDEAGTEILHLSIAPNTIPILLDKKTGQAISIKRHIDEYRLAPEHKRGTAQVTTLDSFINLTNRHKTEHSVIFADTNWQKPSLTTVVDYHKNASGGAADYGKHRVHYAFPLSDEWKIWVGNASQKMSQQDFAEFIEDNIGDLTTPHEDEITYWQNKLGGKVAYPNEIQGLSRGLKINAETKLRNSVTLATGEGELTWEEEHRDHNGQKLIVPSLFFIRLPIFFQGEAARVPVRLRYRVHAGSVTWFYQLYRPDTFVTEQVMLDLERAASMTDLPAYQGAPEMTA